MLSFTDQIGRTISLPAIPRSIVSLVPSQTELLYSLGLEDTVTGITKFCVHPADWFRTKTRVGGTKNVNLDKIASLHPDLIIANKEENVREQVEALAKDYPVYISDVNTLEDAYAMIRAIGTITDTSMKAETIARQIAAGFATLHGNKPPIRTAYLIWKDPYMTIGHDTFIHHILIRCGWQNVFEARTRYPAITMEDLQAARIDQLLLSSEPYPFKQQHIEELQSYLPHTPIQLVDGEMFSWYGSRLLQAPAYLQSLLKHTHLR